MLFAALALSATLALFALCFALTARGGRRLFGAEAKRAAAAYQEMEARLAALGAGLGVGA